MADTRRCHPPLSQPSRPSHYPTPNSGPRVWASGLFRTHFLGSDSAVTARSPPSQTLWRRAVLWRWACRRRACRMRWCRRRCRGVAECARRQALRRSPLKEKRRKKRKEKEKKMVRGLRLVVGVCF